MSRGFPLPLPPCYPDLRGRTVLITGGANGIGAAMVRAFRAQESEVHFCDVDEPAAAALADELGSSVHFTKVDLTKEREIARWIARIDRIDVLINNAAADPRIALGEATAAQWDSLFARNLRANFLTVRESLEKIPRGGSIINFASITFHAGPANMTAYVATKGGVLGLTRSMARELGPRGIRVNTLSPGWIMTERQLRQFVTPAIRRLIRKAQCIPDLLQPEEIARVAVFLGSNASAAITGQEILADRGWHHS